MAIIYLLWPTYSPKIQKRLMGCPSDTINIDSAPPSIGVHCGRFVLLSRSSASTPEFLSQSMLCREVALPLKRLRPSCPQKSWPIARAQQHYYVFQRPASSCSVWFLTVHAQVLNHSVTLFVTLFNSQHNLRTSNHDWQRKSSNLVVSDRN